MTKDEQFLGTEPIGRLLFKLAVPTVAAQVVNMLYNIVDRIYIGHMPLVGKEALTGVGVCMPLITIISAFAAFVSSGGAPRASIALGRGDREGAERIMGACLTLQLFISAVLTVLLLVFGRQLLLLFGCSENTIEYAHAYMTIYATGTLFVQLTLGMNAFISAQGFASISMRTVVLGAGCNLVLDPLFIFALKMGVQGAALATVLSQCASCVWVLHFLTGRRTVLHLRRRNLFGNLSLIPPCLSLGLATFFIQASSSMVSVCFNSTLLKYGGDTAVGSMTILHSVLQFAQLPMHGISQSAQPIISYNFGAGSRQRVRQTFRLTLVCSLVCSTAFWAAIELFPAVFVRLFTPDGELVAFAARALRIFCSSLLLLGIQTSCQAAFVATGNAPCSIMVAVLRKFILLIPLIFLLPHLLPDPVTAVYLAEPIADVVAISGTVVIFSIHFPRALARMEAPVGTAS